MFIRKNKNRSGSISIQLVEKKNRKNRIIKTVGVARTKREEKLLIMLATSELERLRGMESLFMEHDDLVVDSFVENISNDDLRVVGTELILGKIYQKFNFPDDGSCNYFRNLVLSRLVFPGSKLKTVEYFQKHLNTEVSVYTIYRFLEKSGNGFAWCGKCRGTSGEYFGAI